MVMQVGEMTEISLVTKTHKIQKSVCLKEVICLNLK